jgi:hypothetical protein
VGERPHSGFSPSAHSVSGIPLKLHQSDNSNHTKQSTALFRAPTAWTCHLANQRGALSHAQWAGSVYKAAVWSTRDSALDAALNCGYNGISVDSKISIDWPGSDSAGRPLILPRSRHDPAGSRPSTAGRTEWPAGLAAEAIPVFQQFKLITRLGQQAPATIDVGEVSTHRYLPHEPFCLFLWQLHSLYSDTSVPVTLITLHGLCFSIVSAIWDI